MMKTSSTIVTFICGGTSIYILEQKACCIVSK